MSDPRDDLQPSIDQLAEAINQAILEWNATHQGYEVRYVFVGEEGIQVSIDVKPGEGEALPMPKGIH